MTLNTIKFIYLQEKINQQIDQYGQADIELCNELDSVLVNLTVEEQDQVLYYYL
jgi:hypothetical protein